MAEKIFLHVLETSMTASYVIIAVIAARLLLRKFPKRYSYALWSVCAFRLVFGSAFNSVFSIFSFKIKPCTIPENIGLMKKLQLSTGIESLTDAVNTSLPPANQFASVNPMQITVFIYTWIWIIGLAAVLIYSAVSYLRLYNALRGSVRKFGNVYETDKIPSPFIFGIFRPRIYVPFGMDGDTLECVLEHERCHLRRCDYIIKPLAWLILAMHWFNPFCHAAFYLMNRDMEMSCDEAALKTQNSGKYSESLLSAAVKRARPYPLYFGETGVKPRIKNVLKYHEPNRFAKFFSIVLCIAVTAACAANPKTEGKNREQILYDSRTEYVGDAPGAANLIRLTMPEGYSAAAKGLMQLHTDEEPYGLTIYLNSENFDVEVLKKQAYMLFALIGDVGVIDYNVSGSELTVSRGEADSALGRPAADFAKSFADFKVLYEMIY